MIVLFYNKNYVSQIKFMVSKRVVNYSTIDRHWTSPIRYKMIGLKQVVELVNFLWSAQKMYNNKRSITHK